MATGNRLKIRHGTGTPSTSNLLPYELGWNGEGLYINNATTILKLFGSTMSFDDITTGNLVVTGGASFTNIPTAPTAPSGTNNTQLATTAFVTAAISGQSLDYLPLTGGTLSGDLLIDGATLKFYNDSPFRIKYGSIAPTSASLQNNDIYFCTGEVVADVNALAFDGAYSAETNKAATVSSITTRVGNSKVFYGTCASTAATAEKQVTCTGFTDEQLIEGVIVIVKFDETNSAAVGNITLKVGTSTAKNIKYIYNGGYSNIPAKAYLAANQIYHFTYDGTYWIVELNYNTNTNTLLRTYSSATNIEVPLIAQSSAASTTAAWTTYTDTSKDWYGVIPNVDNIRAKINLSTGHITVPGGITSTTPTTGNNSTLVATTAFVNTAINNAIGAAIGGSY